VDDLCFESFSRFSIDRRRGCGRAQDDAGGAIEETPDGPESVGIGKENLARTLLFGAVIPATEEGKSVAEVGYFGFRGEIRSIFERLECGFSAFFWSFLCLRQSVFGDFLRMGVLRGGREGSSEFCQGNWSEHERLGEEGAADGGLFADGSDAEGGEPGGAEEAAVVEEEEGGVDGAGGAGLVGSGGGGL
jgi:hypothetical protein